MITERIDNITKIDPAHYGVNIPAPNSVKIELTGRCNFNCSYCARSMKLREQKDMDFTFYKRVVQEMYDAGVRELGLFYLGESFLYKQLPEAIAYAKDVGFPYVFLTTNGSLSDSFIVGKCIRAGLDSLKFSLNYADEEQFVSIARVKASLFEKVLENIRTAKSVRDSVHRETGHKCGLYASYIAYDTAQANKMKKVVDELSLYLDEIYALPLYNQASFVQKVVDELGYTPVAGNLGRLEAMREPLPCWSCFTEGHITYDGRLSACCFDHDNRFTMGNLNDLTFMQAWNSEKFQDLRRKHLAKNVCNSPCEKCVIW